MKKKIKKLRRRDALEKALGAAQREQYLKDNPHGYSRSKSVHKDKNQYTRKNKHKKRGFSDQDSGKSFFMEGRTVSQLSSPSPARFFPSSPKSRFLLSIP